MGASAGPPPLPPPPVPPVSSWARPSDGGAAGGGAAGGGTPWDRRREIGLVQAFFETTQEVLLQPVRLFSSLRDGSMGGALLYGVIAGYVGLVASTLYQFVFNLVSGGGGSMMSSPEMARFAPFLEMTAVSLVVRILFGPIQIVIGVFVTAGIYHVLILLTGGTSRTFETTVQTVSYAQAPALLSVIPVCGSVIAFFWYLVAYIVGLSEAHGISRARAAAVVLIPALLLCCCCVAAFTLLFGGVMAALGGRMPQQ
jgi:hypothetical protein